MQTCAPHLRSENAVPQLRALVELPHNRCIGMPSPLKSVLGPQFSGVRNRRHSNIRRSSKNTAKMDTTKPREQLRALCSNGWSWLARHAGSARMVLTEKAHQATALTATKYVSPRSSCLWNACNSLDRKTAHGGPLQHVCS